MKNQWKSQLEEFIKGYKLKQLNLKCKCSFPIEDLCVSDCGEPSLHCQNKQCKYSNQKHKFCRVIKLQGLTELLERRFDFYKVLLQRIQQIEQNFIVKIRKEREQIYNKIVFRQFQGEQIVALEQIFIRKNVESIKGAQIEDIYKSLLLENKLKEQNEKELIQFQSQFVSLFSKISEIRQILIKQEPNQLNLLEASKILNFKQVQQSRFVINCLNNPKDLNLLFRASQNQFSATKFHEVCDGVPDLLVLVKTEFGKVIGGFNPIGWKRQEDGRHSTDNQNKCFIFSVTLRQKMYSLKSQFAIYNHQSWGPLFGSNGRDLYLSDKCKQNKNSGSKFPQNYNFLLNPYLKGKQTNKLFSGSTTQHFSVADYEVFKVIK